MSKSILRDEDGTEFLFDRAKFKQIFDEVKMQKNMTKSDMETAMSDETGVPEGTIHNHLRPNDKSGANTPKRIADVKEYGKYLAGDEYAFLSRITVVKTAAEDRCGGAVNSIFRMLYDILACYEASDCFNCVPGTEDTDGARSYFDGELGKVKKVLESEFLGKRDSADFQKLERIINETEFFVKRYSVPGVVDRWITINPQINFFDCVFELIDELGIETVRQLNDKGILAFLPNTYDIKARNMYFAEKAKLNAEGNLQYTEERIFQNELLRTLAMVFGKDFGSGEDNSRVT